MGSSSKKMAQFVFDRVIKPIELKKTRKDALVQMGNE